MQKPTPRSLSDCHAVIMGVGGLGSAAALYLAAAGVGRLTLWDPDVVDISNLHRQIIHDMAHLGAPKVRSAASRLLHRHPQLAVDIRQDPPEAITLGHALYTADIVLDGTDNFEARYLINRLSVQTRTPLVSAAAIGVQGQLMLFDLRHPQAPCYRCLFPDDADDTALRCVDNGVLGPVVGVMGSLQAQMAVNVLRRTPTAAGDLLRWDALSGRWQRSVFVQDPHCPLCAVGAFS